MSESTPPVPPPPGIPSPPAGPAVYVQAPPERKKRSGFRVFLRVLFWMLFGLSLLINLALLSMVAEQLTGRPEVARIVLEPGNSKQVVAFYNVYGVLDGGSVKRFRVFCNQVVDDENVRAIVLRVNSPGGGVTSSNEIHHMVKQLQSAGKTVVVSMGAVAASGGYMVSCSADHIVAEPTTVTGSIGVIMTWLVLADTLDAIGVEPIVIKSTDAEYWKDDVSLLRLPDDRQMAYLRDILDQMQDQFTASVRQGRGSKLPTQIDAQVDVQPVPLAEGEVAAAVDPDANEPLNGKVYLAADALRLGLIDQIGYREDAFARAASLAGLDDPHVVAYRHKPPGLMTVLFGVRRASPVAEGVEVLEDLQTPKFMAIWKAQ